MSRARNCQGAGGQSRAGSVCGRLQWSHSAEMQRFGLHVALTGDPIETGRMFNSPAFLLWQLRTLQPQDGLIEFSEFVAVCLPAARELFAISLQTAFHHFDTNSNGNLDCAQTARRKRVGSRRMPADAWVQCVQVGQPRSTSKPL